MRNGQAAKEVSVMPGGERDSATREHVLINLVIVIKPRMAFARVEAAGEWQGQLANEPVISHAKIS